MPRPGAYLIARDAQGRVAVLDTDKGCCLPGGGADPGETLEQTLRREVLEECGCEVGPLERVCDAMEYVFSEDEGGFAKSCTFFRGTLGARVAEPVERDHVLRWLPPSEASSTLKHRSQGFAVMRAVRTQGGKS